MTIIMNRRHFFTYLLLLGFTTAIAQTHNDSLYAAIVNNDDSKAMVFIERIEKDISQMKEEDKSDFLYLKGIFLEKKSKVDDALNCFRESAEIAEGLRRYDQSFYDAILRFMLWSQGKPSYYECVKLGFYAINTPMQNQREYSNMHRIYSSLVTAMLHHGLIADVPNVAEKGDLIIKEQVSAADDEYHAMPFSEAIAWLMMGNAEKAESIYEKLSQEKPTSLDMQSSLASLHHEIVSAKEEGWDKRKAKRFHQIDNIGEKLLLVDPSTTEGSILWKDYFSMLRSSLEFFHFDTSDIHDESLWSKSIANMIIHFYIGCDKLPDRESVEYDNIICRKNFLNYHYGFHRKRPMKWGEIQDALSEDEAAIEISCVPEDILIIKKNEPYPVCIRLDSLLFERIAMLNNNDAIDIDAAYAQNGPLAKMWEMIEPALGKDIRTVYISGSNIFSEINYDAIPLDDGNTLSDRYDIHTLLCTSDIVELKQDKTKRYKNACLIGGVDYMESNSRLKKSDRFSDAEWNFTSIIPQNMRSGFHYLPHTLTEVNKVHHLMDSTGIENNIRKGKEATEEFFKGLSSQSPDIIHLATHGFMLAPLFNDTTGQRLKDRLGTQYQTVLSQSGLLLSGANKKWEKNIRQNHNDGILTSKEIAELDLSRTNIAVLMACKSGLGDTTNLTGVPFGVAYAFRMAGVKQILCCLWEVEDEVASTMITSFYHHLFTTDDAKEALQLARKELIKQGYTSPFYWAPFILIE